MDQNGVIQAVREAFDLAPDQVDDYLEMTEDGRVGGVVVVKGSPEFDEARSVVRTRRVWDRLRQNAADQLVNMGAVILLSEAEAAASGLDAK